MEFAFIQVVDIFIKLHKVFNLEYNKEISKTMQFFEYFAYDLLDSKRFMTNRMEETAKRLLVFDGEIETQSDKYESNGSQLNE